MRRFLALFAAAALVLAIALPAAASTTVTTPNGTWTADPGQSTTSYSAAVQQPINANGLSNFKANGKTVIPVKFALSQGTGAFIFESYVDSDPATYAYSNLNWSSNTAFTFAELTELNAVYDFTVGDCQGGSLRWTLTLVDSGVERNLDVHYQPGANSLNDQFCAPGTSGQNLIGSSDTIYVIQEFTATHVGAFDSSYNTTYADAVDELGGLQVVGVSLIVDSGWKDVTGDAIPDPEKVDLTSATVGVASGAATYTDTFTPLPASALTSVCPTLQASIRISKVDGLPSGDVNEPLTIQPQDNNGIFRIVDCKYMYSLATSSLSGVGTYTVYATIGGTEFPVATFDLK